VDEDVIQLRLSVQRIEGELTALTQTQKNNHLQNRGDIEGMQTSMEQMTASITAVAKQVSDYLLVQADREAQRAKAWWKAPLGTAIIVLMLTIGWDAMSSILGLHPLVH
jgi:hypothetical protein